MMMTEQEAKAKWCPNSRVMDSCTALSGNRWCEDSFNASTFQPLNACCASKCMAWRWASTDERGQPKFGRYQSEEECTNGVHLGYCGAFGRPGKE